MGAPEVPSSVHEVWVAQQVEALIQALPAVQQSNPLGMKDAVRKMQ
jgi:hypothetical protein